MLCDTLATAHFELELVGRAVREGKLDLRLKLIDEVIAKLREAGMAAAVVAHAEPLVLREPANDDAPGVITVIWGEPLSTTVQRSADDAPVAALRASVEGFRGQCEEETSPPGTRRQRLFHAVLFASIVIVLPAIALLVLP